MLWCFWSLHSHNVNITVGKVAVGRMVARSSEPLVVDIERRPSCWFCPGRRVGDGVSGLRDEGAIDTFREDAGAHSHMYKLDPAGGSAAAVEGRGRASSGLACLLSRSVRYTES